MPPDILSIRSDFLRHITREGLEIQTSIWWSHCQRMAGQLAQAKKHLRNFETKLNFGNVKWNRIKWSVLTVLVRMGSNPSRTRKLAHDFALNWKKWPVNHIFVYSKTTLLLAGIAVIEVRTCGGLLLTFHKLLGSKPSGWKNIYFYQKLSSI